MSATAPVATSANDLPLFNWLTRRASGVLLHPTSLPGEQGIGTFEPGPVNAFLDFLAAAGFRYWQVCPLGPTGYGDSPYQCFSAFAGNPYLVDVFALVRAGWLTPADVEPLRALDRQRVDFGQLWQTKGLILSRAHARFCQRGRPTQPYGDFAAFQRAHADWLAPYAYFRALKDHYQGQPWWDWPPATRRFASAQNSPLRALLAPAIEAHAFAQFLFFAQWAQVRASAAQRGLEIIGDLPIFVARDSADTWAAPGLFELDEATGQPLAVAGVPPDYFSADGQLWGNPLYRWDAHAADGYAWWLARLRASFAQADVIRIDHFRGFDEYWRIPADAATAKAGAWRPGPGLAFFRAVRAAFPDAKIIAEDLGEIGPSVRALRDQAGLPGMEILQFAFGGPSDNLYLPHNHLANALVYSGTHDNDTSLGWYAAADEKTRDHVRRYLGVPGTAIGWDFVRAGFASVSRLAIFPLQDLLSLGSEARFNTPGHAQGNWQWRYQPDALARLSGDTARYLHTLGELYDRVPRPAPEKPATA
ncbi:MAG: 4-alpha-glucanotransferase [Opitutae bacterium]|nr:4-alpha-glucanotransferase [Opitutae bacterium]